MLPTQIWELIGVRKKPFGDGRKIQDDSPSHCREVEIYTRLHESSLKEKHCGHLVLFVQLNLLLLQSGYGTVCQQTFAVFKAVAELTAV